MKNFACNILSYSNISYIVAVKSTLEPFGSVLIQWLLALVRFRGRLHCTRQTCISSAAFNRLSQCVVMRGLPMPNSHFRPVAAPHVGQRTLRLISSSWLPWALVPLLCQTMRMADRREFLKIETYVCGIPASAVCRRCEVKFVVARSLAVTPQKAVEQFYAEFDSHKCHPRETEREAIRADAA